MTPPSPPPEEGSSMMDQALCPSGWSLPLGGRLEGAVGHAGAPSRRGLGGAVCSSAREEAARLCRAASSPRCRPPAGSRPTTGRRPSGRASLELGFPVDLPARAAVGRERLLPARGVDPQPRPAVANAHRSALELVVAFEQADITLEAP